MKSFLNDLLTFLVFVAAIVCFYFAAAVTFSSALFNFILFFAAIFFLIQGAGFIDRAKGFGKYSKENPPAVSDKENDSNNENDN